jgi:hypothetical protein
MLKKLAGLVLIFAGLALCYYGWWSENKVNEIKNDQEWDDAVNAGGGGSMGLVFGAMLIFVGIGLLVF